MKDSKELPHDLASATPPRSLKRRQCKRFVWQKTAGTRATRRRSLLLIRSIPIGENRAEFLNGREEIVAFLHRKWTRELDYRLTKELWAFTGNRIAVRFAYEYHDDSGNWYPRLRKRELGIR